MLELLPPPSADPLLEMITLFRADPRLDKTDLGVGVYRDFSGNTPVMGAIKKAEAMLQTSQDSKSYLGPAGNELFLENMQDLIFGQAATLNVARFQTPGCTGALRVGFEMLKQANPAAKVWVMLPTWANHIQLIGDTGIEVATLPYLDDDRSTVAIGAIIENLSRAKRGDIVLLHGCCHNPTGIDLHRDDWEEIIEVINRVGLVPLIDLAYQGFGSGIEDDVSHLRHLAGLVSEFVVTTSCSKTFGLYRERTGAIFVGCKTQGDASKAASAMAKIARGMYSMPPDHGAAIVALVLSEQHLRDEWRSELNHMRNRINSLRQNLANAVPHIQSVATGHGMFSMLPLSASDVLGLREEAGIFVAPDGRINISGLSPAPIDQLQRILS